MGINNLKMDMCCFCIPARPGLIVWGYIKIILLLLSTFPLYFVVMIIAFYGTKYESIVLWSILISYPIVFIFTIVLIVVCHVNNLKGLKVCFFYLIFETMVVSLLVPWVANIVLFEYTTKPLWPKILIVVLLTFAQGIYSIILVKSEINKLSVINGTTSLEAGYTNIKDNCDTTDN